MMRIGLMLALSGALVAALVYGANWLRNDARADLLRELQIEQIRRTEADVAERNARIEEIENADTDELHRRACSLDMLPESACQ